MNAERFSIVLKQLLENRLNQLNDLIDKGILIINTEYCFNNLLRCAETPTHFIAELLGAKQYRSNEKIAVKLLQKKVEKISATNSYFIPFSENITKPVLNMLADACTLQGLALITNENYLSLKKLPFPLPSVKITNKEGDFPLNIDNSVNLLILKDMTLIQMSDFNYYYRYIPFSIIVKKNVAEQEIIKRLEVDLRLDVSNITKDICVNYISGINFSPSKSSIYFANQLISMSNQIIREPSIDRFIFEHKSFFANGLGYRDIQKITFKWIERNNEEPCESKPDFILIKENNTFDILDVKTGAIKHQSLVKGKKLKNSKVRIRFVDYVSELISQLDEYKNCFKYAKNQQFIKEHYKLDLDLSNMKLIGIVGNQNNFDSNKIASALSPYKDNIKIISYFDLANMILKNSI
jgi:hypothetical protein